VPGRIVRTADFERLLARPALARSVHFAVHHLQVPDAASCDAPGSSVSTDLSTDDQEACAQPVDDSAASGREQHRLGVVVPKRYAREATTRNLIKRQARECFRQRESLLARGWWLLRLRHGFDRQRFRSAASEPLRAAARAELDALLCRAAGAARRT
jgi:ribonuclease P protein component